jgi:carbon storage regulator
MLILSRKVDEKIMIGDDISISIIEIKFDQVKIGIDAPKKVKVFRKEIFDEIGAENKAAAAAQIKIPDIGITSKRKIF